MSLYELIKNRRSIRKYKNTDIPNKIIEELVECARLAPSAKNRQPWYFVIIRGKLKDEISDAMILNKPSKTDLLNCSLVETANVIKEVPVLILVFKEKDNRCVTSDMLSIGAAIENICLKATELNLGSLWIRDTVYAEKEISEIIKIDKELVSAVAIGYADEYPIQRPRKALNSIILYK